MKIICISGKAGSGKDTFAMDLKKALLGYGEKVLIIHFADLLKHICTNMFGWDGKKDERGRHLLQYEGTEVIRNYNPNFFVNHLVELMKIYEGTWDYVLIPDCRFPNEIQKFIEAGFETIHIRMIRSGATNLTEEQQLHSSETALDSEISDDTVVNSGTLVDLYGEAYKISKKLEGYMF